DFAALDYTAPEKNRYAYRLEGFDERWNEIGQEHSATYTNLPAGSYVFRVKASNADGVWNEDGVALPITVKPPFWRTWWFRALVLLLIAFGVGRYLRATRERHRELERINRRLAEAADRDRLSQQYLERNVLEILGAMESFSEGDLSVSLPVDSDDAIGRLRRGFNTSVANIRGMVLQLQELVHATAAASEEILASTEELARQAEEQMRQSGRVAGSMERMRQSTEENARHMGAAAELAQRSGQDAEQGTVIVRDTLTGMDQIVSMVGNAAEAVQTLRGSGERIGQITAVISEIAGETNLVALNAAIEAARAGEHGRTFSVVAEEVRKLADRAELAAHEIADVIEQNQADIARAVAIMGEVGGQVDTGKHLVDEAGSALDSVIANSQRVIASIGQVTRAGEEQTAASQNVAATVEAIASGSRAAAEGNQVINRAVEDLNRLIEDVQERVGQFQLEGGRKAPAPAAIAGAAAVPV
ncbi:MAG TPA: methyl-accepting chemotaxis protein, partial [Longimicrobiales bacterium]